MKEIRLDSVDSTQTYAKEHKSEFSGMTCVIAEEQTAGRGRFERTWDSPKGNIYASFYFNLPSQKDIACLSYIMAHSIITILPKLSIQIKWPNDLLLNNKKFCGILTETAIGHTIDVFLGVGINVNRETFGLLDATSLKAETGHVWDLNILMKNLQKQFTTDLETFLQKGFAPFHSFIVEHLAWEGKQVQVDNESGILETIAPDGALLLRQPNGLKPFYTGTLKVKGK